VYAHEAAQELGPVSSCSDNGWRAALPAIAQRPLVPLVNIELLPRDHDAILDPDCTNTVPQTIVCRKCAPPWGRTLSPSKGLRNKRCEVGFFCPDQRSHIRK
jgi:hypothetical protein